MQASTNDILRAELAAGGAPSASLRLQAASVEAYLEYRRIVGDADGGTLFTEAEYAAYRAGAQQRAAARLYVHWRSAAGVDCKAVGPESQCECGHRFREHARPGAGGDEAAAGGAPQQPLRCRAARCACPGYAYLPAAGTWAAKCGCKHAAGLHDPVTKRCARCACSRFGATFSCACGLPWAAHGTAVEGRLARLAAGRPVDNLCGGGAGYAALGGLTTFSSLVDGCDRAGGGGGGLGGGGGDGAGSGCGGAAPAPGAPPRPALGRLKAGRAAARGATPPEGLQPGRGATGAWASDPPPPAAQCPPGDGAPPDQQFSPPPPEAAQQTFAQRRRAAAEAAAAAAAGRRAAARLAEDEEIARLPELEQLHRLSLRKAS